MEAENQRLEQMKWELQEQSKSLRVDMRAGDS
jgi:hypothetical protein